MKAVKIILLTVISLVLLLVIGLVAAINLIDINRHHDRIAQLVHDKTGRELRIEGDLEWGVWPRLYLNGGPLSLGNAPGFGPEPFLRLESFRFAVATWPLRRSEIHLDTFYVSGLLLNLERDQEGLGNWENLAPPPDPDAPLPPPPDRRKGLPFEALALGGVDVDDAAINWHDHGSGQQTRVSDLRLVLDALTFGEPMQLTLDFTASSNQPEMQVAAEAQATLLYDLAAERYAVEPLTATASFSGPTVPGDQAVLNLHTLADLNHQTGQARIEDFRLEGLGALVRADLTMHDLEAPIPGCRGEITVDIADLVELLNVFESPLGRQLAGVQERGITLATEFNAEPARGRLMIPHLEAQLLGTTISGRLEAEKIDTPQPRVLGGIRAEGPDLPALLAVATRLSPGADRDALPQALAGLRERDLLAEANFTSEGRDIVIPHLYLRGLATELTITGRLSNLDAELPIMAGEADIAGKDLPLLLRVASVFQGGPAASNGGEGAGAELWALAERAAAARRNAFSLTTDFTADPAAEQLTASDLRAAALGLEATADLTARGIMSDPAFQLNLALAPFNPRQLMTILDLPLPTTTDPTALTSLTLNAEVSGGPGQFTISPLQVSLDDSNIQGEIVVNDLERPDLAFRLEIDEIDLDRYLPPESETPPVTPEVVGLGTALLPIELLRELRLEGDLRVARLKISGLRVEDFTMGVRASDGQIMVAPLDAALYQGEMAGTIGIDARDEQPALAINNRLSGIQAGPLLRDLTGTPERIRGRADISYELLSRGAEIDELKAALGGEARFSFRDGAVTGINIGRLLRQTSALVEGRPMVAEPREATTDFTSLTGSAQIENGLISNRDLSLMSPLLRVTGAGTTNLVSEEVDYLLTATVVDTPEGQEGRELEALRGISVPIRVTGTFDALTYRPDLGTAGLDRLRQNLRQLEDKLQEEGIRALEDLLRAPRQRPNGEAPAEEVQPEEPLPERLRQLFPF